jgi:hypothetical protein
MSEIIRKLGAIPSAEDERDYQVSDLLPIAKSSGHYPSTYKTDNLPNFIIDQGDSEMCVACSLSYVRYIQELSQSKNNKSFSPLYIYGNRDESMYLGEGMCPREALSTLTNFGVCHESDLSGFYTYNEASQLYTNNKDKLDKLAKPFRIDSYYACNTEMEIKSAVMHLGAVTAMFPVYRELYYPIAKGVINYTNTTTSGTQYGYHQMTIVGWTENSWIVLNSWGKDWGDKGYGYIPFNYPIEEAWAMVDNILEVFFNMFIDVPDNHYAKDAIEKATNKGVVNGFDDGTFGPDQPLTRAQLVVILDRLGLLD